MAEAAISRQQAGAIALAMGAAAPTICLTMKNLSCCCAEELRFVMRFLREI